MVATITLLVTFFLGTYELAILAFALPSITVGLGLSATQLDLPVALNLVGCAIGGYSIGYLADRFGRQLGLRLTFIVLGVGSLASAFAWDDVSLTIFRFVAGCGMGAVVSMVSSYVGENSSRDRRGLTIARLGVIATALIALTSIAAVPLLGALPGTAWRILLGIGAIALLLLLAVNKRDLFESPRWLVEHNQLALAEKNVRALERRSRATPTPDGVRFVEPEFLANAASVPPWRVMLRSPVLRRRLILMSSLWFLFYIGFFGINNYLPSFLEDAGIKSSVAITDTAVTRVAGFVASIVLLFIIERIERRTLIIASIILLAVGVLLMVTGIGVVPATIGAFLLGFGTGSLAIPAYAYGAEIFPTESRTTGAAILDGFSRLGGAVAPFAILPLLVGYGSLVAGIAVTAAMIVAMVLMLFGVRTKGRTLEEIAS
jgi:putative MFS transporter